MTGKVLVVDDLVPNVKLLEAKLTAEYYAVCTAYSGKEAIEAAKRETPDIILLDVMMPEMNGFEVCRLLKSDPKTAYVPVVMVTALSEQRDRVEGLRAGATDFITKPIDEVHLFARVRSLIRLKQMLDELRLRDKTGSQFGIAESQVFNLDEKLSGVVAVIDDDVIESQNIKKTLDGEGLTTHILHAKGALDKVAEGNFDIVIVNTLLDDVDGLRLCTEIRSQEKTRQLPLMMLVDDMDKERLVKGLEIGIDDYVMAPIDPNELVARTRTQLRRKKYQDALKSNLSESLSAAVVDALTKLYNRRYLNVHLSNMVTEALQKNTDLTLMTIDIDHFKEVNDKPGWGHHIGDEILIQVAQRVQSSIRNTDLATRPGGEEFVVVMPNTDLNTADKIAERVRKNIFETPFLISANPGYLTRSVSIGVANLIPNSGDNAAALLQRSDKALYAAKNGGRNRVVLSKPMETTSEGF